MITATMPLISILNIEQIHILFLIISSAFIAFLLPPASAPSMCLFSNQEWIKITDIYKYGIPTIILLGLITFIWNYLFFMFI